MVPAFLLTLCIGCKKEQEAVVQDPPPLNFPGPITPTDFRDPIVGNYAGTKNNYLWIMGGPPTVSDTTYPWTFTIIKDTTDSSILADGYLFKLDTALSCYEIQFPGPTIRSFEFRNDSAIIFFRSGGLGGYSTTTIKGVKQ